MRGIVNTLKSRWKSIGALIILYYILKIVLAFTVAKFAGLWLIAEDPVGPADLMVVLSPSSVAHRDIATDLYQNGLAKKILIPDLTLDALDADDPSEVEEPWVDVGAFSMAFPSGVVETLSPNNLEDLVRQLTGYMVEHSLRSAIVLAPSEKTRRIKIILEEDTENTGFRFAMLPVAEGNYNPEEWYLSTHGIKIVVSEYFEVARVLLSD